MNLTVDWLDYAIFLGLVLFSMVVDHHLHKDNKAVTLKSAVNWSIFWVAISFVYAGFLWFHHDSQTASLFVSGYVLEKVLSVDNLFVFSAIFAWFGIPNHLRHRVLYWGVIGAIVFRLIFVVIGAGLLKAFGSYAELLFAILIGYAAVMMLRGGDDDEEVDYENHLANKLVHKFYPVVPRLFEHRFFVKGADIEQAEMSSEDKNIIEKVLGAIKPTAIYATPLLVCAAVIELSDVMFAFDSVPAVIAVSKEPLIVYSSMLFAILGLRTLYFVLEALKEMLHHLEKAIIVLLFFIAIKLALSASLHLWGVGYDLSPNMSLMIVLGVLSIGVIASLLHKKPVEVVLPLSEQALVEQGKSNAHWNIEIPHDFAVINGEGKSVLNEDEVAQTFEKHGIQEDKWYQNHLFSLYILYLQKLSSTDDPQPFSLFVINIMKLEQAAGEQYINELLNNLSKES